MANRRMFSLDVVDTDLFLDMPASTQALYFHLGMRADDDGFVSSPKKITSMVNCGVDDLNILIAKGLVIAFESGIVVITDWKVNNYIQKDRYKSTKYIKQKDELTVEEDGSYRRIQNVSNMEAECIQDASNLETQVRLGKDSINIYIEQMNLLWSLYPNKKGKAIAFKKLPKLLKKYGYEQLEKCVQRYVGEVQGKEKQYIAHGSTFFNSGYVDYLDENYQEVGGDTPLYEEVLDPDTGEVIRVSTGG